MLGIVWFSFINPTYITIKEQNGRVERDVRLHVHCVATAFSAMLHLRSGCPEALPEERMLRRCFIKKALY